MLHWYRERIVWTDKALNLKLLRKGILTRIYAPMVIVQRLRETGVFTSVIASAQKVLSSVTNSSTAGVTSSSKIGHDGESKATARRVLQIPDNATFSSAIPPLSPPGLEGIYMEMWSHYMHINPYPLLAGRVINWRGMKSSWKYWWARTWGSKKSSYHCWDGALRCAVSWGSFPIITQALMYILV